MGCLFSEGNLRIACSGILDSLIVGLGLCVIISFTVSSSFE